MATLDQRIYDADQAKQVLENPAFARAFADIKQEYMNAWANSPARDKEGREELFLMVKLTNKLELTLQGMLDDGKQAKVQLEYQQNLLTRQRAEGFAPGST